MIFLTFPEMVKQVNVRIKDSIRKAGSHVTYVDWDWAISQLEGRFCEEGVKEPAPERDGLLFFQWLTLDDGDDPNLRIRPGDPVPSDSFEGSISKWIVETVNAHPDWAREFGPEGTSPFDVQEEMMKAAEKTRNVPDEAHGYLGLDDPIWFFIPDSWKRKWASSLKSQITEVTKVYFTLVLLGSISLLKWSCMRWLSIVARALESTYPDTILLGALSTVLKNRPKWNYNVHYSFSVMRPLRHMVDKGRHPPNPSL